MIESSESQFDDKLITLSSGAVAAFFVLATTDKNFSGLHVAILFSAGFFFLFALAVSLLSHLIRACLELN